MNKNKILSGGGKNLTGGGKWGWRGREVGGEGEGSGVKGGGKWGERGREVGVGYPPVHPLIYGTNMGYHMRGCPDRSQLDPNFHYLFYFIILYLHWTHGCGTRLHFPYRSHMDPYRLLAGPCKHAYMGPIWAILCGVAQMGPT